jgi:hypothetical protein
MAFKAILCGPIVSANRSKWTPSMNARSNTGSALRHAGGEALPPRRRQYSTAFKLQVLREIMRPGASIASVALRHNMNCNVIFRWRREYRLIGRLVLCWPNVASKTDVLLSLLWLLCRNSLRSYSHISGVATTLSTKLRLAWRDSRAKAYRNFSGYTTMSKSMDSHSAHQWIGLARLASLRSVRTNSTRKSIEPRVNSRSGTNF